MENSERKKISDALENQYIVEDKDWSICPYQVIEIRQKYRYVPFSRHIAFINVSDKTATTNEPGVGRVLEKLGYVVTLD